MRRKQALGFTLVELAVVILLISIFMGLGLSALDVQQTNRAYSETREKQEKIKDALVFHLSNFRRLPCPDTTALTAPGTPPDGKEDREALDDPTTPCVDPGVAVPGFGVIPYLTLGLSRDDALDGWDNFFSYQVSLDNAGTSDINEGWSLTTTFFVGNEGSITLNDRDAVGTEIALNNLAAVIVSHGRNGLGAYTTKGTQNQVPLAPLVDELDNTDADSEFFKREFTDIDVQNGGPFDDLVLALTPSDLLTPVIKDGALRSATAQALSQVEIIADTAFGRVPVNGCVPPTKESLFSTLPADVPVDPWGQSINYDSSDELLTPTSPASETVAFCAWSSGPDRTTTADCTPTFVPTDDDVGLPRVNYEQLRTAFTTGATPPCPTPPP